MVEESSERDGACTGILFHVWAEQSQGCRAGAMRSGGLGRVGRTCGGVRLPRRAAGGYVVGGVVYEPGVYRSGLRWWGPSASIVAEVAFGGGA